MKITLSEIAKLTEGALEGAAEFIITGAAGLEDASERDISFLGNPKYGRLIETTKAGCVFLPNAAKNSSEDGRGRNRIYVEDPQWAYAQILMILEREIYKPDLMPTADSRAAVHREAKLEGKVSIGPFSVVDRGAVVGAGSVIGPQCFIGFNARVGKDCKIYPQVVIRENCVIGDRVIIHSGTVVGSDGYGFCADRKTGRHRKIPQLGNVVVENDVEIGSNVSIDRATIGSTVIGEGTKIDNLVQIGHNVRTGKNCLIVAQVGVSGSTQIGRQVTLAGQAGIVGHVKIGDGAVIAAQSGVMGDVEPKAMVFGSPARPHREAMKLQALLGKLPEIYDAFKEIKNKFSPQKSANVEEKTHAKNRI